MTQIAFGWCMRSVHEEFERVVQLRRSDPNNGATSGMLIVSRPPSWKSGEDNDESRASRHARIPEMRTVRIWIRRDRVELVGRFYRADNEWNFRHSSISKFVLMGGTMEQDFQVGKENVILEHFGTIFFFFS